MTLTDDEDDGEEKAAAASAQAPLTKRDEQLLHGSNVTSHASTSTSDVADDCAWRGCLERWTAAGKQAKCANSVFNSTYLKCGEFYGNSRNDNVLLYGLCTALQRAFSVQCTLDPSAMPPSHLCSAVWSWNVLQREIQRLPAMRDWPLPVRSRHDGLRSLSSRDDYAVGRRQRHLPVHR